jgi:tRNA A37 methylthiotransferase MiaB
VSSTVHGGRGVTVVRKACIAYGLGCPRVQVDTAQLFEFFRVNGWEICDSIEEADLVVVMSCGFCGQDENWSFELLEAAERRRRPGSRLVIGGCLAGINEQRLRQAFDADLVAPRDAAQLEDIIGATVRLDEVDDPILIEPYIDRASRCFSKKERWAHETPVRAAFHRLAEASGVVAAPDETGRDKSGVTETAAAICSIRVAKGCMGDCSYCAIRFAAGPLQSKPLAKVLEEFDLGLREGYTQFRVVAGDLGCYGQDLGTSVVELLEGLMRGPAEFHLTLQDFNLKWFVMYQTPLVDLLLRNSSRIRSVLLPVQSGSERMLARMRRGHTANEALAALGALRAACPDMVLDTHVLIGFPGETDEDFEDTLELLRACRFDHVTVFNYEDRPKTDASRMEPKVPWQVIKARGFRLTRETEGLLRALQYYVTDWGVRFEAQRGPK